MNSEHQLLAAVARISETLNRTLSLEQITQAVVEECVYRAGAVGARVVLQEAESGDRLNVQELGTQADVQPFVDRALATCRPVVAGDICLRVSDDLPAGTPLSGLFVPVLYQSAAAGSVTLLFPDPAQITEPVKTFAGAAANLVAAAIGNLTRYEELSARNQTLHRYAQQIERVVEAGRVFHAGSELPAVYEDLVYTIQESVDYSIVVLSIVEDHAGELRAAVVAGAGLPLDQLRRLEADPLPWKGVSQLMKPEFAIGNAFLIPAEGAEFQRRFVRSLGAELYLGHPEGLNSRRRAFDLLCIPLRDSNRQPLGLLSLAAPPAGHRPDLDTVRILEIFANQAAASIENIRLYHDTRTFAQQLSHLQEVSQGVLSEHDPTQRLQLLVNGLQATGWQRVLLIHFQHESVGEPMLVTAGYSAEEYALLMTGLPDAQTWRERLADPGLQQHRLGSGIFTLSVQPSEAHDRAPRVSQTVNPGKLLWLPIHDRNEQLAALIQLDQPVNGLRPARRTLRHIELFARFTAAILENMKLVQDLRALNQELDARVRERTRQLEQESDRVSTLLRISTELTASLDRDWVLARALSLINETIGATWGYILLVDGNTGLLRVQESLGQSRLKAGDEQDIGRLDELTQQLMGSGKPAIMNTLSYESWIEWEGLGSALAAPLTIGEETTGVLMLLHDQPGHFTEQHLDLATAAAIQVAQAVHNAELYDLIRRQAETLGKMMRDAQDEVAKTHSMLESIGDGVLVAQAAGEIILVNESACSILKAGRDELLLAPVSMLAGRIGPDASSWLDALAQLSSGSVTPEQVASQTIRVAIGSRVFNVTLSAVRAGQRLVGSVSVLHDMTREVEVDRLKSEFVSTVSHELRTPMTSVKGYADLLLMGIAGELNAMQEGYLRVIKSNADRLGYLVDDLLDISRIETGKVELQLQAIDLSDLIAGMLNEQIPIKLHSRKKQLDVRADIPGDIPAVVGDPEKVAQILANLLDNAINYTPAGGEICISCRRDQEFVWTSVSDNGIGIAEEQLPKIFDRFYRAEEDVVQGVAGTGLGLSIVRSLVELHGGEIQVKSRLGEGSTFMISLPVAAQGEGAKYAG